MSCYHRGTSWSFVTDLGETISGTDTMGLRGYVVPPLDPKGVILDRIISDTISFLDIQPIPGPRGPQGEQGIKGDTGDQGPQGIPGISPVLPPNYDGRINVRNFGAIPDTSSDASLGINAAIAFAKSRPHGGTVYIPAGSYFLASPIYLDYSGCTTRLDNLVKIVGDGIAQTRFFCWGSGGIALQGTASNPETHFSLAGMRFLGSGWGIGLNVKIGAYCRFEDLIFENFGIGGDFQDIEQSLWINCHFNWNDDGAIFHGKYLTTDPNSNTFINFTGVNNKRGLTYENANAVLFNNGSFQYNGDMSLDPMSSYGVKFINPGTGYGNVKFASTIFEGNGGCADIWWHADSGPSSLALDNASIIRIWDWKYTTHSILVTGNSPGSISITNGTTFKHFGSYSPDGSRKHIHNDNANCIVYKDPSVIFQSPLEAP